MSVRACANLLTFRRAYRCIFLLAPLLLVTGCGQITGPSAHGNPRVGAVLYTTQGCIACHEINGVGGTIYNKLTNNFTAVNVDLLKDVYRHPPSGMAYLLKMHITDQQIRDVAAFANSTLKPAKSGGQ